MQIGREDVNHSGETTLESEDHHEIDKEGDTRVNQTQELPHDDSDQDDRRHAIIVSHKPYGNLKVIRSAFPHISLGPDYICFIPAFLAFAVSAYYVIILVLQSTQSLTFHVVTLVICIGQPLAYLLVGLSDPGVVTEENRDSSADLKNCLKCQMMVPRHSRHCNDCDVCIANYDHHCPWTSKCIGGGNLIRFYVFLASTPIYMIYITIAFVVCMSNNLTKIQHLQKHL